MVMRMKTMKKSMRTTEHLSGSLLAVAVQRGVLIALSWVALTACEASTAPPTLESVAPATPSLSTHMGALTTNCSVYVVDGYDGADYKSAWCTGTPEGAGDPVPVSVVEVNGKPIEVGTANAYVLMANAAASDPVNPVVFNLEVGMRTMKKQMEHWQCDQCADGGTSCASCTYDVGDGPKPCGSCNDAACPGKSNHQMGTAVDITTGCLQFVSWKPIESQIADCEAVSPAFKWLMAPGNSYGFYRTYWPEAWHWVYQPWINPGPGGGPCGSSCESGCLPTNVNGDSPGILNSDCSTTSCGLFSSCSEAFGSPECISAFCNDGVTGVAEGYQCFPWGDYAICDAQGQASEVVDCPDDAPCTACGSCGGDCGVTCETSCETPSSNGFSAGIVQSDCSVAACPYLQACTEEGGAPECVSTMCLEEDDQ